MFVKHAGRQLTFLTKKRSTKQTTYINLHTQEKYFNQYTLGKHVSEQEKMLLEEKKTLSKLTAAQMVAVSA